MTTQIDSDQDDSDDMYKDQFNPFPEQKHGDQLLTERCDTDDGLLLTSRTDKSRGSNDSKQTTASYLEMLKRQKNEGSSGRKAENLARSENDQANANNQHLQTIVEEESNITMSQSPFKIGNNVNSASIVSQPRHSKPEEAFDPNRNIPLKPRPIQASSEVKNQMAD